MNLKIKQFPNSFLFQGHNKSKKLEKQNQRQKHYQTKNKRKKTKKWKQVSYFVLKATNFTLVLVKNGKLIKLLNFI